MRTTSLLRRATVAALAVTALLGSSLAQAAPNSPSSPTTNDSAEQGVRLDQLRPVSGPRSDGNTVSTYYGRFYIKNRNNLGMCLDAWNSDGGGNGNRVGLWQCNGGITEQWDIYNEGGPGNYVWRIRNARNGRSLDYPASSGGANGWQYLLWDYVNSSGQQFWLYWRGSDYEISNRLGGGANVMDAFASDGGGNGTRVGNWSITSHPLQRWVLVLV